MASRGILHRRRRWVKSNRTVYTLRALKNKVSQQIIRESQGDGMLKDGVATLGT
jgi:hypothetical protein